MGNISSLARASTALDSYVAELGNDLSYDRSLSSSRFLKSIIVRHANGPLVLKIFIKPDAAMSLRVIQRRLKFERDAMSENANINTYQAFVETDKAGYLIRQWIGSNLYDRLSLQPYLADVEKKWIAYQVLDAMRDARLRKVGHGDIKSENILITSDLTVQITDFSASYKPTFLPLDDPSDFDFFFDTSGRRACYIAPERIYSSDSDIAQHKQQLKEDGVDADNWGKRDGKVTEEMDVFSVGCVLAEMWADGKTVFDLGELYKYRNGLVDIKVTLSRIAEPGVRTLIGQMISLNPKDRPSFERILTDSRGTLFPEYFYTFLQEYLISLSELASAGPIDFLTKNASASGSKIDRLLDEWESILVHLEEAKRAGSPCGPALLLLNVVSSGIRNASWPSSRLHGLQLFLNLLPYLTDEEKVDRVVPFAVELLSDEASIVRAEACRVIVLVLENVQSVTQSNATFIPEYLIPQMRHLANDSDVFVRATYARGLHRIADAALRMLELSQAAKPWNSGSMLVPQADYDTLLLEVQSVVEEQVTILLVDGSSNVKRSTLTDIEKLCLFFGRQKSNDTVLSHMMTFLNDRDWMLRLAFFDGIVSVGPFVGNRAVEEYVLPLMLQALADAEEAVVARVIASLITLAALGSLPRMRQWDVFFALLGLALHPNAWIRQGAAGFIAAIARQLPETDVWCILYPLLRPLLTADILELDETSILSALIPPLSRSGLVAARAAALQRSPPAFWNVSTIAGSSQIHASSASVAVPATGALRDKGISSADEVAIGYMKEFIMKNAHAARAREGGAESGPDLTAAKSVSLTDLGVTPQTIFISPRTIRVSSKPQPRLLPDGGNSRRTSFAAKSAKSVDNPLEEIRRRLASIEPPSRAADRAPSDIASALPETAPSESAVSSTLDLVALGRKKKLDSKAAPAVSASHTTAVGTTTIHDETVSGRETPSTPRGAAPVYGSSYEGQDPAVREFLDQVDLETYREPLLDFGPKIVTGAKRRGSRPKSGTQGGITMIAHLAMHTAAVTSIVVAPDHLFFATASEDGTVLVWDSVRLERSVSSKPRLRHLMNAPITAMCRIEGTHCLAVAAEDGQLHVLRVHVASSGGSTKYGRLECIRTWRAKTTEGHVVSISHLQETSALLVVTSTSVVAVIGMRNMEISRQFQHPLELGVVTSVCPSTHWLIIGTNSGALSLWDVRFGLLLKTWNADGPVLAMQIHPSKGRGRWLIVSTGRDKEATPIAQVYDIETSALVETFEVRQTKPSKTPSPLPPVTVEVSSSKADVIARLGAAKEPFALSSPPPEDPSPSILTVSVGQKLASLLAIEEAPLLRSGRTTAAPEPGYMVTAGEDRVVRFWDLGTPSDGFVVCGSQREKEVTFNTRPGNPQLFYTIPSLPKQPADSRHVGVATSRQPLRPHYDAICALGTVETPFSSCVISADRSGVVKVWRIEGPLSAAR